MLGRAAIGSLSVRHPCRSSSASSARSRSSTLRGARPPWRPASARGAGDPAPEREPRRLDRPAGRRALRRRAAGDRRHAGPAPGLRPAQAPRPGDRDAPARLPRPRRAGDARPEPVRAARGGGRLGAARTARPSARRRACARRSRCGAGRRSPTSPTSRSRRRRSRGSRSSGSPALEQRIEAELGARRAPPARRRAGGARGGAPDARALPRPAHDRALPVRSPGGRARRLPRASPGAGRDVRDRADAGARRGSSRRSSSQDPVARRAVVRAAPPPSRRGGACSSPRAPRRRSQALAGLAAPLAAAGASCC